MFENNVFGPEKPFDRFSFLWKLVTGFLVIMIVSGVFFLFNKLKLSSELQEMSLFFETMQTVSLNKAQAGGDVVMAPMVMPQVKLPELVGTLASPENFNAKSIIIKDHETGIVLYKKNEYDKRSIASITKLMSALIMLEKKPDWTSKTVVIGADSLDTHMYAGDTYTLDELWHAALVGSSNKAILSLANALDWPIEAFVERMNSKARELGMIDSVFAEPTGLDEENKSTASDLAILLSEAMKHEKIREALLTTEYNLYSNEREKSHHMWSTNWLLLNWIKSDFGTLYGGKTGYTNAAGYSFVMEVSDKNNHIIDVVVLGTDEHEARFTEARDVAKNVFESYKWPNSEIAK